MIYFLKHPETGLIKIGTTIDYRDYCIRLSQLITQYGDLELLGVMTGLYEEEKRLHERFKDAQSSELPGYEWFEPTKKLITYIEKYSSWGTSNKEKNPQAD